MNQPQPDPSPPDPANSDLPLASPAEEAGPDAELAALQSQLL